MFLGFNEHSFLFKSALLSPEEFTFVAGEIGSIIFSLGNDVGDSLFIEVSLGSFVAL
jgi:hypothetical protein